MQDDINIWEANPKLKNLLLVLMFVFLASGIGLVVLAQVQNQYRQKLYAKIQATLPKHKAKISPLTSLGTTGDIANWKTYRNEKYGFTLDFPDVWQGYKTSPFEGTKYDYVCFSIKNTANAQPFCLLHIVMYTKVQWDQFKKQYSDQVPDKENEQFVYQFDYNKECSQENDFQCERLKEVPQLLSTFKFTK